MMLRFEDPSQQSVSGQDEELVAEFVATPAVIGPRLLMGLSVVGRVTGGTARLRLRLGGTPGGVDGVEVVSTPLKATTFEPTGAGNDLEAPPGFQLVKVTVQNEQADTTTFVRSKAVELQPPSR